MNDTVEITRPGDEVRLDSLTGSLGFLLRLSQLVAFREFFAALGDLDVRPGEISVLMAIGDNPGVRQGVLARRLMIKRAHMAKMIHAMEDGGLVSRSVPPDDKRSVELRLTLDGEARVRAFVDPFFNHETHQLTGRLTRHEVIELKRLLRKYIDLPEPASEVRP